MQVIYINLHIYCIFFQISWIFRGLFQFLYILQIPINVHQLLIPLSYKKKLVKLIFMKKTIITTILISLFILAFIGCQSVPTDIPADVTEAELTKLAQAAYDNGNTKAAKVYYETIIERYGSNTESLIAAKFELAHLLVKEKKYEEAKPILEEILGFYPDGVSSSLPPEYKKLAQIDLAKITNSEN